MFNPFSLSKNKKIEKPQEKFNIPLHEKPPSSYFTIYSLATPLNRVLHRCTDKRAGEIARRTRRSKLKFASIDAARKRPRCLFIQRDSVKLRARIGFTLDLRFAISKKSAPSWPFVRYPSSFVENRAGINERKD